MSLVGFLRSLFTDVTLPVLLPVPGANTRTRGLQKKPPPSASQKTPWYISSRINTLLLTSRRYHTTSFDLTYVPTRASRSVFAASLSARRPTEHRENLSQLTYLWAVVELGRSAATGMDGAEHGHARWLLLHPG